MSKITSFATTALRLAALYSSAGLVACICPEEMIGVEGICYKKYMDRKSSTEAENWCSAHGGSMAGETLGTRFSSVVLNNPSFTSYLSTPASSGDNLCYVVSPKTQESSENTDRILQGFSPFMHALRMTVAETAKQCSVWCNEGHGNLEKVECSSQTYYLCEFDESMFDTTAGIGGATTEQKFTTVIYVLLLGLHFLGIAAILLLEIGSLL